MTTLEVIELLRNAIDYDSNSEYHLGYTAKEIHRKCLTQMLLLEQEVRTLREMVKKQEYKYQGWGKGKDE